MRSTLTRSITVLMLVIAMAVGMTASLGGKAQAATPINIAYAAGDDAKINGGPVYNVNAYVGVATTITTVKPTRSGCNFLGWTTTKNSGRVDYKSGQTPVTFTKATTLWPVWNANIAYAAGDGKFSNGSPVMNVSVTLGKATTVPTSTPIRSGYEFLGWSTIKNSSTVQYKPGASITYTKPMTLWPVWDTKCTILYMNSNHPDNVQFQQDTPLFNRQLFGYLSKRVSKVSVSVKGFSGWRELMDGWNSMPKDQAVVIINCHGWPGSLSYTFSIYDVYHELDSKNIKAIILVACNCGHKEHSGYSENIAQAFATQFKCVVYASDGNVSAFTLKSGTVDWKRFNTSKRTQNSGWLVYDGRNYDRSGKVELHTVGSDIDHTLGFKDGTTIDGLLDAYYTKYIGW